MPTDTLSAADALQILMMELAGLNGVFPKAGTHGRGPITNETVQLRRAIAASSARSAVRGDKNMAAGRILFLRDAKNFETARYSPPYLDPGASSEYTEIHGHSNSLG
jgi:hypothetical protein